MDIRTVLVNLDIDSYSSDLVALAASLAVRFDAHLIGLAAAEPAPPFVGFDGGVAAIDLYKLDREDIEARLRATEEQFRAAVPAGVKAEWRANIDAPNRALTSIARCADLIVTGSATGSPGGSLRTTDLGELVLTAGRPVLVAGTGVREIKADKIVVGWKDMREARRAIADALPFLKTASDVVVVTIGEGNDDAERISSDDCVSWLHRHGVKARPAIYSRHDGVADTLESYAKIFEADLVVTGGYGHSRFREWLLGGMTRELLASTKLNRFMSN